MRVFFVFLLGLQILSLHPAAAGCAGTNLFDGMPAQDRARLEAAAAEQPFHKGNFWRATKDGAEVILVGTYHLDDPRHAATLQAVAPFIEQATTVLVEAGPEEEQALMADAAQNPALFVLTQSSLPELMDPTEWDLLSAAMQRRGIPGFMAAKFQPWYVTVMLALPPCMMAQMEKAKGLDGLVIQHAKDTERPIRALEPHDTVFKMFDAMTQDEQIAMIRSSLAIEDQAEDYMATLADSYFAGQSRLIWELMRDLSLTLPGYTAEQVEADLARMEQALLISRNTNWIPVIESAAAEGPVFAAFGALHLPGRHGIPFLLQQKGWALTPLFP